MATFYSNIRMGNFEKWFCVIDHDSSILLPGFVKDSRWSAHCSARPQSVQTDQGQMGVQGEWI